MTTENPQAESLTPDEQQALQQLSGKTGIPYERIVQWAAGPYAILCGWLATQITNHFNIFGTLGFGRDHVAHAIFALGVFIIATVAVMVMHMHWFRNLANWWQHTETLVPEPLEPPVNEPDSDPFTAAEVQEAVHPVPDFQGVLEARPPTAAKPEVPLAEQVPAPDAPEQS